MEPDPGPLGLHSAEESCPEEDLYVTEQLLGPKISASSPLPAKFSWQLSGNQQLGDRPGRLSLLCTFAKHWDKVYHLNPFVLINVVLAGRSCAEFRCKDTQKRLTQCRMLI